MRAVFLLLLALYAPLAHAKVGHYRRDNQWGLITSIAGAPAPSNMGERLAYNVKSFGRLSAGVGLSGKAFHAENWLRYAVNYTVRPILFYALTAVVYVAQMIYYVPFHGKFNSPLKYSTFLPPSYKQVHSMTTFGGGFDLLVPGWDTSPFFGAHYAVFQAGTTPNLPPSGKHLYYTWGIDWQSKKGRNFAIGYNFCPKFLKNCGVYANLGFFF